MAAPPDILGMPSAKERRKRIEGCFWLAEDHLAPEKGAPSVCKVHWIFTLACAADNLVRIRNLTAAIPTVLVPGRSVSYGHKLRSPDRTTKSNILSDSIIDEK
jgi:hypothetical protein